MNPIIHLKQLASAYNTIDRCFLM